MELLPMWIAIFGSVAAPVLLLARGLTRLRDRHRNRSGQCAGCGTSWAELPADRYFVEGVELCTACANRARRTITRALVASGAITVIGTVFVAYFVGGFLIRHGMGPNPWYLFVAASAPPLLFGAASVFALRSMRAANTRALGRDDPLALGSGQPPN